MLVAVCAAMFCLVYGFSNADTRSWSTPSTWGFLAGGVAGLVAFIVRQARAASPLLPLRIVLDRNRGGAYLAVFLVMAGVSGVFLFLTYYLQDTRGYTPVGTGLAYGYLAAGRPAAGLPGLALLHGYTTAFWWAAGILTAGAFICGTLLRRGVLTGQGDSRPVGSPASPPEADRLATADRDQ
jgi:hypothetical protein